MLIHWLCWRLTSKFCLLMSPIPKSQTFFGIGVWCHQCHQCVWCHQWYLGQISTFKKKSCTVLSNGIWILEAGLVVWKITGGWYAPPPHTGYVTRQTPMGCGLTFRYTMYIQWRDTNIHLFNPKKLQNSSCHLYQSHRLRQAAADGKLMPWFVSWNCRSQKYSSMKYWEKKLKIVHFLLRFLVIPVTWLHRQVLQLYSKPAYFH